jgi:hypothetical protein
MTCTISHTLSCSISNSETQLGTIVFDGADNGLIDVTEDLQVLADAFPEKTILLKDGGTYYLRDLDPMVNLKMGCLGRAKIIYDADTPAIDFNHSNPLKNTPTEISAIVGDSQQALVAHTTPTITAITTGSTTTVTFGSDHGISTNDRIKFANIVGTTELNGNIYIAEVTSTVALRLLKLDGTRLNSTGYGAWASGGTASTYVRQAAFLDDANYRSYIEVADASGYSPGDIVAIISADVFPSDGTSVRSGEASEVSWVDTTNNLIYLTRNLYGVNLYFTTPYVTRYKRDQEVHLFNLDFEARQVDNTWDDPDVSPRNPAIDIYAVPKVRIENCHFNETWGQCIILRGCPYSLVDGEETEFVPNILTQTSSETDFSISGITTGATTVINYLAASQQFDAATNKYVVIKNVTTPSEANGRYIVSAVAEVSAGVEYSVTITSMNDENIDSTAWSAWASGGTIELGDVDGLGYGVSVYGMSHGTVVRNGIFRHCRHGVTTDGAGDTTFNANEWYKYGVPTDVEIRDCVFQDGMGPMGDTHCEGYNITFDNCLFTNSSRGWLGGSYTAIGIQIRMTTSIIRNCRFLSSNWQIRFPNIVEADGPVTHLVENCIFESPRNSDLVSDAGIYIDDRGGRTYASRFRFNNNTFRDCGTAIRVGTTANIIGEGNKFFGCVRLLDARAGSNVTLYNTFADYRGTKRLGNTHYSVLMRSDGTYNGSTVRLYGVMLIQGELTQYPTALFREMDTTATKYYDVTDLVIINPSGVTETTICSMSTATSTSLQQATGRTSQQGQLFYNQAQNDFTLSLPAGCKIDSIIIRNKTANAVTGGIKVGTTNGGTEVVTAEAVGANAFVSATLNASVFSATAATTLYFQDVTAWNSAVLDVVVNYSRGII